MPTVTVWRNGKVVGTVELYPAQRLFAAGGRLGLDKLGFGDCGGQCICATCHVRVKRGNFAPMERDEAELLDTLPEVFADSRLACQLVAGDQPEIDVEWVG